METREAFLEAQFEHMVGTPLTALLQDIDANNRYGNDLKHNGVHAAINSARTADDPSVPMGQWEHDLNTADWDQVNRLSVDALANKSKDLQIAIWLLEAQIHQHGFTAIAPCLLLLQSLTEQFWDGLYPQIESDDDLDYRTNLIAWINEKLQPVIKQLPICFTRSEQIYTWADWEMAAHYEQLPAEHRKTLGDEYIQTSAIVSAIVATPLDFYRQMFSDIEQALVGIDEYSSLLDKLCGEYAPSLLSLRTLLSDIYEAVHSHVRHRTMEVTEEEVPDNATNIDPSQGLTGSGPIKNRHDAYARLAEAAEYLAMDDPHSPVPYLIYKAIDWGQLNTAELYQELFVQYQGQLNIFELLGLELDPKQQRK